jgi:hypothetical protein
VIGAGQLCQVASACVDGNLVAGWENLAADAQHDRSPRAGADELAEAAIAYC